MFDSRMREKNREGKEGRDRGRERKKVRGEKERKR